MVSRNESRPRSRSQGAPSPSEQLYKLQASVLRDFLAAGGIDLKQTNALEAVAKIHGAKDWQTLRTTGQAADPLAADEPSKSHWPSEMFSVVMSSAGGTNVSVSDSLESALLDFLQSARMCIDLFEAEEGVRVEIIGQDEDAGLPYLVLLINDVAWVELVQPSRVLDTTVRKDSGGSLKEVPRRRVNLQGIESQPFQQIGLALSTAFNSRSRENVDKRSEKALRTMFAQRMSFRLHEAMQQLAFRSSLKNNQFEFDPSDLMRAIERVGVMHGMTATVKAGEDNE